MNLSKKKRFRCWFGLHSWFYVKHFGVDERRECIYCDKKELLNVDRD